MNNIIFSGVNSETKLHQYIETLGIKHECSFVDLRPGEFSFEHLSSTKDKDNVVVLYAQYMTPHIMSFLREFMEDGKHVIMMADGLDMIPIPLINRCVVVMCGEQADRQKVIEKECDTKPVNKYEADHRRLMIHASC